MPSVSDYKAPFSVWTVWSVPSSGRPTPENGECAQIWMGDTIYDAIMMTVMFREQFVYAHKLGLRRLRTCAFSFVVTDDSGHVIENDRCPHLDMMPAHPAAAASDGARGFYEFDDIQSAVARERIFDRIHSTFRWARACRSSYLRLLEQLDCALPQPDAAAADQPAQAIAGNDNDKKMNARRICDDLEEALARVKRVRAAVAGDHDLGVEATDLADQVESEMCALIDTFRRGNE